MKAYLVKFANKKKMYMADETRVLLTITGRHFRVTSAKSPSTTEPLKSGKDDPFSTASDDSFYETKGLNIAYNIHEVTELKNEEIVAVHSTPEGASVFVLTKSNRIISWGSNYSGELGHAICAAVASFDDEDEDGDFHSIDKENMEFCLPKKANIHQDIKIKKLAVGFYHVLTLTEEGDILTWGNNVRGQLGLENCISVRKPTKLDFTFNGSKVANIDCSAYSSVAVTVENKLFYWGYTARGDMLFPMHIETKFLIKEVMFAYKHCFILSTNNKVRLVCFHCIEDEGAAGFCQRYKKVPSDQAFSDGTLHEFPEIFCPIFIMKRSHRKDVLTCNNGEILIQGSCKDNNSRQKWNISFQE